MKKMFKRINKKLNEPATNEIVSIFMIFIFYVLIVLAILLFIDSVN